jgi:hypothetical protein
VRFLQIATQDLNQGLLGIADHLSVQLWMAIILSNHLKVRLVKSGLLKNLVIVNRYCKIDHRRIVSIHFCPFLQILAGLDALRADGVFCDVVIVVQNNEFPVHKSVLSAASSYFKAMFTCNLAESMLNKVPINGVEAHIIKELLDYTYSSEITISKENVQNLLSAANLLEILPVRDACCQFLDRHMDESNCLGIQGFAEAHSCTDLQQKARAFALKHFTDLVSGEEFESIHEGQLVDLICSDELEVNREEDVFNAVVKWVESSSDTE